MERRRPAPRTDDPPDRRRGIMHEPFLAHWYEAVARDHSGDAQHLIVDHGGAGIRRSL